MTQAIWKFPLTDRNTAVPLPKGAHIVHVGQQGNVPMVWIQLDPFAPTHPRIIRWVMTGEPFDNIAEHVGTFIIHDGGFVGHVLEPI